MLSLISRQMSELDPGTQWGIVIIALISGFMTYGGLTASFSPLDNVFWWKASAAFISAGVSVAISLFWAHAMVIAPNIVRSRHFGALAAIVLTFKAFLFFFSSAWNTSFIADNEIKRLNIVSTIVSADHGVAALRGLVTASNEIVPDLDSLSQELSDLAQAEADSGVLSGSPGCGGVCITLENVAGSIEQQVGRLQNDLTKASGEVNKAVSILEDLRALDQSTASAEGRIAEAGDLVARLNQVIGEASTIVSPAAIARAMEVLPESFIVGSVRKASQRAAVAKVRELVRARAEPIAKRAHELAKAPPIEKVIWHRYNALTGSFVHWRELITYWMTGIGLDWSISFILLFRVLAADAIRRGEHNRHRPTAQAYTAAQLFEIVDLVRRLKRGGSDSTPKPPAKRISKTHSERDELDLFDDWEDDK